MRRIKPHLWLARRSRFWETRDLPYALALRAAAAELSVPERWGARWEQQPRAFQTRVVALLRRQARKRDDDAFDEAAERLELTRGTDIRNIERIADG